MAVSDLSLSLSLQASGRLVSALDLSAPADALSIGSGNFAALSMALSFGTGTSQANQWWHDQRSILTTDNDDIDLTSLTGGFGAVSFSKIKWIIMGIVSPDGTKALRFGPQNVTNAWDAVFGAAGATIYETFLDWKILLNRWGGWTVDSTHKILRINNPGAETVSYNIWVGGLS